MIPCFLMKMELETTIIHENSQDQRTYLFYFWSTLYSLYSMYTFFNSTIPQGPYFTFSFVYCYYISLDYTLLLYSIHIKSTVFSDSNRLYTSCTSFSITKIISTFNLTLSG